jgi:hypothetical protein
LVIYDGADAEHDGADAEHDGADEKEYTPLCIASRLGHKEVVKVLLEGGADTEAALPNGSTSLYIASENGHLEVVKLLLAAGAEIPDLDQLELSAHVEIAELLLEAQFEEYRRGQPGQPALCISTKRGFKEAVEHDSEFQKQLKGTFEVGKLQEMRAEARRKRVLKVEGLWDVDNFLTHETQKYTRKHVRRHNDKKKEIRETRMYKYLYPLDKMER